MNRLRWEVEIRALTLGIVGAAALAAGLLLVRQREVAMERPTVVPAGESQPAVISLDRIRAQGF